MFVIIGTVTADLMVLSDAPIPALGGDGFRSSNLIFTQRPVAISMGGNGGNSAYVLAGLGAPTALCGAVGQDLLGDALVNWLQAKNVNLAGLTRSPTHATSSSTIIMASAADQIVFHHLGATAVARFDEMPENLFDDAEALLVSSFPIMSKLRAGGFAQALARVHAAGGITALDIGPAIGEPVTLAELIPLLPTVDYLIANTHELISLTDATDWPGAARQVLAAGARRVVIKQGEEGSSAWSLTEQINAPAFKVDANISVGAGDSFNAGFLYAVQQGWSQARALRFGAATAALVIAGEGGTLAAPTLAEVEKFLETEEIGD
jgi:sugar/nucleoside kinase (ribokinase family)